MKKPENVCRFSWGNRIALSHERDTNSILKRPEEMEF